MRLRHTTRRDFLGLSGSAAVAGIVTLRPAEATPATLNTAIRNVVGEAHVQAGKVKIDIPPWSRTATPCR